MKDIILKATFGDEVKEVLIGASMAGAMSYHVYMDNYYHGCIHKMSNGWIFSEQKPGIFTFEDMQFMIDVARKHFDQNF